MALFGERLVPFDLAAAQAYAKIVVRARRRGHPLRVADAQIAAIAAARRFSVATRDEAPFMAADVPVINPWTVGGAPSALRRLPPEGFVFSNHSPLATRHRP